MEIPVKSCMSLWQLIFGPFWRTGCCHTCTSHLSDPHGNGKCHTAATWVWVNSKVQGFLINICMYEAGGTCIPVQGRRVASEPALWCCFWRANEFVLGCSLGAALLQPHGCYLCRIWAAASLGPGVCVFAVDLILQENRNKPQWWL